MGRLVCAIALIVSLCTPAIAAGSGDTAAEYYEKCAGRPRPMRAPADRCDDLLSHALGGMFIAEQSQERPHVCLPADLKLPDLNTIDLEQVRQHPEQRSAILAQFDAFSDRMHATVAEYIRQHPDRRSEKALEVMFEAFRDAFPCPD